MIILYFLLAGSTYGFCCFVFDIYRLLTYQLLTQFPPDRPLMGTRVKSPQPRPEQSGAAEAKAEVEGAAFSAIP